MSLPPFIQQRGAEVLLALKVQPRASRNAVGELVGNELKIKVTAPPVDSAANQAVLRFLSDTLDCPHGAVQLVRGETSRHKVVSVRGVTPGDIAARLVPAAK